MLDFVEAEVFEAEKKLYNQEANWIAEGLLGKGARTTSPEKSANVHPYLRSSEIITNLAELLGHPSNIADPSGSFRADARNLQHCGVSFHSQFDAAL